MKKGGLLAVGIRWFEGKWKPEVAEAAAANFGASLARRLGYSKGML